MNRDVIAFIHPHCAVRMSFGVMSTYTHCIYKGDQHMDYQKKMELEDKFIEANGQHPLWVYERKIKGKRLISYEDFLQEDADNRTHRAQYPSIITLPSGEESYCLTEEPVDVITAPAIGGCTPTEVRPVIRFESFSNIDLDLIKRTSSRLGQHSYQLYKKIRAFSVEQWKNNSRAFLMWLDTESYFSEGTELIQLNPFEPYGPDNCMLSGDLKELYAPINSKHDTDFAALYGEMSKDGTVCKEWATPHAFLHWLQHHEFELPDRVIIERIDAAKDYSPSNCRFISKSDGKETKKRQVSVEEKIKIVLHLGERCGINPYRKYSILVEKGYIDINVWPLENYLDWVIDKGVCGELAPYLKRLDRSRPYSPDNAYFSWKPAGKTHGMSNTKLYRKYQYFMRHYKERILPESQLTFEEFMETALKEKDYQINSRMKIRGSSEYVSMDNVTFVEDEDDMEDIIRICSLYQGIPKDQNEFGGLMNFMEWTIRQGYQSWMEFRKIAPGCYSPKTCVWDVFTEVGYIASKGARALRIYNRTK